MNQTVMLAIQLVLLGAIFYFFMIRPENKRRKAVTTMQNSLSKGDRVVTLINDEGQKWIFERHAIARKVEK